VKRRELENIVKFKTKGAIIRSKARWYNEDEKDNKYFLNLENRHCKKKKTNHADYIMQRMEKILCNSFIMISTQPKVRK